MTDADPCGNLYEKIRITNEDSRRSSPGDYCHRRETTEL